MLTITTKSSSRILQYHSWLGNGTEIPAYLFDTMSSLGLVTTICLILSLASLSGIVTIGYLTAKAARDGKLDSTQPYAQSLTILWPILGVLFATSLLALVTWLPYRAKIERKKRLFRRGIRVMKLADASASTLKPI